MVRLKPPDFQVLSKVCGVRVEGSGFVLGGMALVGNPYDAGEISMYLSGQRREVVAWRVTG